MAILTQQTECMICGEPLGNAEHIATSHFISDRNDPLYPFSDAGMHYVCFQDWSNREAFVSKFNSIAGKNIWPNGTRHVMCSDGKIKIVQDR